MSIYVFGEEKHNLPLGGNGSFQGRMHSNRHNLGSTWNHIACRLHGKEGLLMGFGRWGVVPSGHLCSITPGFLSMERNNTKKHLVRFSGHNVPGIHW